MMNVALSTVARSLAVCLSRRWSRRLEGRTVYNGVTDKDREFAEEDIATIRNIGIIAHIDAGKTTTTERMLFYAGLSRTLGEVDDGDTITDYMELERERGITITSASVSFPWRRHRINLIDTPGHVDFTMEVERCLRVLDGAVTVLDASVGVQAQTLTVWLKADHHALPRIVYLNKMDKRNADVQLCLASIGSKFPSIKPLVLQLPLRDCSDRDVAGFVGVVDLLTMEKIVWPSSDRLAGRSFERLQVSAADHLLCQRAHKARIQLVEELANIDDRMADVFLQSTAIDASDIGQLELRNAIRRVTIERKAVPVLCGSSYKNIGVQLLLDAIVDYLPSPDDSSSARGDDRLCALVFKICHDQRMGRLAFARIYSGTLERGQRIHDVNRRCSERPTKLLRAFANHFQVIDRAAAGDIVVLAGTKNVITGDTLVSMQATTQAGNVVDERILAGVQVPPPVFFCSLEAASLAHQKPMEVALEQLCVEDPSLRVRVDADTGQTIVSGLGELHMEIVKDRLLKEHKVEADFGPLQVAYREMVMFSDCDQSSTEVLEHVFDKVVSSSRVRILLRMSLDAQRPGDIANDDTSKNSVVGTAKVRVRMERTKENQENLVKVRPEHLSALERGLRSALSNGPTLGCPVTNVSSVALHWFEIHGVSGGASTTLVSAVASQCVARLLQSAVVRLSEPLMLLEIVMMADDEMRLPSMGRVLADLSTRRAQLLDVRDLATGNANLVVRALVPLAEVVAYSTALRSITSGKATFTIEFHSYAVMNEHDQRLAVHKVQGFL